MTLLCAAVLLASHATAANFPIYLGVIEERPGGDESSAVSQFVARAAFRFENGAWSAMPAEVTEQFPRVLAWTIAFDGKTFGSVPSRRPETWRLSADVGVYDLVGGAAHIPMIREGVKDFDYWSLPKSFRPIPAVSGLPVVSDPAIWKPWKPASPDVARILPVLQGAFQSTCSPVTLAKVRRASRVFKAYRSATTGDRLIAFLFEGERLGIPCGEARPEEANAYYWFLLRGESVSLLDRDLMLIDAGDYDGDGLSELLFHKSGYNYDGYLLLYRDLQKQAIFGWKYH